MEVLVAGGRGLQARGERLDEASAVGGVEAAGHVHAHQLLVVQAVRGAAAADHDVGLVQAHVDLARDGALRVVERVLQELHLGGEPVAVVPARLDLHRHHRLES
jgi:hypothetical protein